MLDSFFRQHHPTSAKNMPPFNKCQIFTLSLKLSSLNFALLLGHHLLFFGRQIFTKLRTGAHSADGTTI
jgi:hypothetical protein